MKRILCVCCVLAILFSFGACGNLKESPESTPSNNSLTGELQPDESAGNTLSLRLVDVAKTGQLVLAGEKSGDVFTVNSNDLTVFLDGEAALPSDLENGMTLTVDPGYELLETWPMQIKRATVRAQRKSGDPEDYGNLCGLYLQVLEDLWTDDSGLNEDISYISVDLDKAPGRLTDGEKAAVTWIFSGKHNAQGLQFGYEALAENGYLKEDTLYWEDGVLFSITKTESRKNTANKITFNAQKWRSGTGAIFYMDCTAKRGRGVKWNPYQTGQFAIA